MLKKLNLLLTRGIKMAKYISLQGIFNQQDAQGIRPTKVQKYKSKVIVYTQEQIQEYIKNLRSVQNENSI
jgi:hypothetical protein